MQKEESQITTVEELLRQFELSEGDIQILSINDATKIDEVQEQVAQSRLQQERREIAQESPLSSNPRSWDKADRVAVVIAGGAALGGAIAQIPGAIIGATLAAVYGWSISFARTKSAPNTR